MAIAWPEEREKTLVRLYEAGHRPSEIARRMGVTASTINAKIDRMGLGRPAPAAPRRIGA